MLELLPKSRIRVRIEHRVVARRHGTAALARAAIKSSGGVPRVLRPTAARPELLPYVLQHDPNHRTIKDLTGSLVTAPSFYGPAWTPLYEKQCDSEFSARMDDWLAYSPRGVGALTVYEVVMAQGIRLAVEASPLPPAAGLVLNDLSFIDPNTACRSRLTRTDLDKLGERVTAELDKLTGGDTYHPSFL